MKNFVARFLKDQNGAVTVDWVVLTAAIVGLTIAAGTAISVQTAGLAGGVVDVVAEQDASRAIPEANGSSGS